MIKDLFLFSVLFCRYRHWKKSCYQKWQGRACPHGWLSRFFLKWGGKTLAVICHQKLPLMIYWLAILPEAAELTKMFFFPILFSIISCLFLGVKTSFFPGGLFWGRDTANLHWPLATHSQGWPWISVSAGLLQRSGILYMRAADTGHGGGGVWITSGDA